MTIDQVIAGVRQGGRILTRPEEVLVAEIAQGGVVTYWGSPRVTSSVHHGGVVTRGAADDAGKTLRDLGDDESLVAPVPPVPPRPPRSTSRVRAAI